MNAGGEWEESLPKEILALAYRSEGTGELAWPRTAALKVLDELLALRVPVVGVEVWLPTETNPTISTDPYYGISIDPLPNQHRGSFLRSSIAQSRQFVKEFGWDASDQRSREFEPYFNFTVDTQ
ncbi:MAG TPA: hypothetical protein VJP86_15430 [Vicinamibacterales bacterium]|jgi:hypothetical protein|nr:hypothetical protein [Vicinamibacterales bacterium]